MTFKIGSGFVSVCLPWAGFKEIMATKDMAVQHSYDAPVHNVFCIDGPICYSSILYDSSYPHAGPDNEANLADFEANLRPHINCPLASARADGVLRVQLEPGSPSKHLQVRGFKMSPATPGAATGTHTYVNWSSTVDFQGVVKLTVSGAHPDDFISAAAVLPVGTSQTMWCGVTGMAWPFGGATVAPIDTPLKTFASDIYVPLDGVIPEITAGGSTELPSFISIRITYTAHGPGPVMVRGILRAWV